MWSGIDSRWWEIDFRQPPALTDRRQSVHTPHDRLFRHVFSDPEHAAGELRSMLPVEVSRRIDRRTLQTVPGTFVDETLTERRSDLLFTARFGEHELLLYLLLEHQSTAEPLMPLRLLRYMVRIWDGYLQAHPEAKRVPAIVPLVVHHSQRGWRAPRRFEQIVDLDDAAREALWRYLPRFELLIDDLSAERDEALRQRVLLPAQARLSLLCLKWSSQVDDVGEELCRSAELVQEVASARNGVAALASVVRYLLEVSQAVPADLRHVFQALGPKTEVAFMTGAQMLRAEGREEGLAEGEALAILRFLERRGVTLSDTERERVRSCRDVEQLERWLDRAVSIQTAAELFD